MSCHELLTLLAAHAIKRMDCSTGVEPADQSCLGKIYQCGGNREIPRFRPTALDVAQAPPRLPLRISEILPATAPEEPPQVGTSGSQRRGFRRTRAGAGGVPAVGGRGGVLVPQVARSAVLGSSGGGGLESHRNPLKSVGTASGWCRVGHRPVPARCARGYPRKRPGSTPNPKSGSEIALNARRSSTPRARRPTGSCYVRKGRDDERCLGVYVGARLVLL
jgi:hypothetical protein